MRVCVVGCGAIGSLFAASLGGLEELEVWVYDPAVEHVRAIGERGLRLSGVQDVVRRGIRATCDASALPPCEIGLVVTKAVHTAAAIDATAHALRDAVVVSLQSGVGNEERIATRVQRVVRGTTFHAATVVEPGHVRWDVRADTTIGPFEPRSASTEEIRALAVTITRAGIETTAVPDARGVQWRKVIFSAATNPVSALTGLPLGKVCGLPSTRRLVTTLVAEGKAVADALEVELDADPEALIEHASMPGIREHWPSMLEDVRAHRRTEVDVLTGAVVRAGREHCVPTPASDAILDLVTSLERSWNAA